MNNYQIANAIILVALVVLVMVFGREWLAWPLAWKLVTALSLVSVFGWLSWRGDR